MCAAVVALGSPAVAEAAAPPGAPTLRPARAADSRSQPGAYQEWWDVRALDPRSHGIVALTFWRNPEGSGLLVRGRTPDRTALPEADVGGAVTATPGQVTAAGDPENPGTARITFSRATATLSVNGEALSGQLKLSRLRRGPAALGFRLGSGLYNPDVVPRVGLSWSMPIASSLARGSIDIRGVHFDLDGWLVSYEHTWGDLIEEDRAWDFWDEWIVQRGGATWIGYGINRSDTVTGPGAREAMWLGLLARVDRRGLTVCRPRIDRRRWVVSLDLKTAFAGSLTARCGSLGADFTDIPSLRGSEDIGEFQGATGPARRAGRGTGWVVHRVTGGAMSAGAASTGSAFR